jgi:hypothetical protein
MSSEEKKQGESDGNPQLPTHTKKPDCPLCKLQKADFGNTVKTCYESSSPYPGEQTKTFG